MSSVEQRVDQQQGNDPTLENHEIATPAPHLEVSLDFDHGQETERATEKVIEQERRRASAEREPLQASLEPPLPTPTEKQVIEIIRQTPKEELPVEIILKKKEPNPLQEEEPHKNKMFPPRPAAREPEPIKITQETVPEPIKVREEPRASVPPVVETRPEPQPQKEVAPIETIEKQELPRTVVHLAPPVKEVPLIKEEPVTQHQTLVQEPVFRLEERVEKISVPPQIEPQPVPQTEAPIEPTPRTVPEPRIEMREQEVRIRVEEPPVLEQAPTPEQAPRLTLEEKIELLRAEMNIKPTIIEEPIRSPEQDLTLIQTLAVENDEPLATEDKLEERPPIQKTVIRQQPDTRIVVAQNRPLPEAELQMEHRRTPTLEQAMKFEFARAKINTGKKATIPGFRGHSFGSGTMLDKLITYLADLIKKLEIRFFSLLSRRRLERRAKPVKVVPTEEEGFHLESFPRSLSRERKKKKGWFFSRFSK